MTDALIARGVTESVAHLAVEIGVLAFKHGFAVWPTATMGRLCVVPPGCSHRAPRGELGALNWPPVPAAHRRPPDLMQD